MRQNGNFNFVHVNGRLLYIDFCMVVVVGGDGNVLHHVKREGTCPGGENVRGNMSEGEMSSGKCPDPRDGDVVGCWLVGWSRL